MFEAFFLVVWRQYWICTQNYSLFVAIVKNANRSVFDVVFGRKTITVRYWFKYFYYLLFVLVKAFVSKHFNLNNSPLLRAIAKQKENVQGSLITIFKQKLQDLESVLMYIPCLQLNLLQRLQNFFKLWSLFIRLSCGAIICSTFYNKHSKQPPLNMGMQLYLHFNKVLSLIIYIKVQ